MTDEREPVERKSVTMRPSNWATVEGYANQMGDDSISKALRRIVEEWAQLKQAPSPAQEAQ